MHFEVYRQRAGNARGWCWKLHDDAHQVVASGEGYRTKADCLHAIDLVRGTSSKTPVIDQTDG